MLAEGSRAGGSITAGTCCGAGMLEGGAEGRLAGRIGGMGTCAAFAGFGLADSFCACARRGDVSMINAAVASPTRVIRGKAAKKPVGLTMRRTAPTTRFAAERANPARLHSQNGFAETVSRRRTPFIKGSSNSAALAGTEGTQARVGQVVKQAESRRSHACRGVAENGIGPDFIPGCG